MHVSHVSHCLHRIQLLMPLSCDSLLTWLLSVILWHQCRTVVCKEKELCSILLVKQCSQENTIGLRIVHLSSTVHAALECSMGILVLAITLPMMTASRRVQVVDSHSGSNIPLKKAAGLKKSFLIS